MQKVKANTVEVEVTTHSHIDSQIREVKGEISAKQDELIFLQEQVQQTRHDLVRMARYLNELRLAPKALQVADLIGSFDLDLKSANFVMSMARAIIRDQYRKTNEIEKLRREDY